MGRHVTDDIHRAAQVKWNHRLEINRYFWLPIQSVVNKLKSISHDQDLKYRMIGWSSLVNGVVIASSIP